MLAQLLTLLAAAAPAAEPPKTVSPVTVTAAPSDKIEKHPDAVVDSVGGADDAIGEYVAVWPRRAYNAGKDGRVSLSCRIGVHGIAEWCTVAAESPPGLGFGRAALELRPTFKLKPAKGPDGQPIASMMTVNVGFRSPDFQFDFAAFDQSMRTHKEIGQVDVPVQHNRLEMHPVVMVDNPEWASAAGFEDLAAAYPAAGAGAEGYAAAHCRVERSGRDAGTLHACQIIKEAPHGQGFGKAALSLMPKFRVLPAALLRAPTDAPLWVDVPVRLSPPAEAADRTVHAPIWLLNLDPAAAQQVFPPEAAAQGLTSGRGVARCTVAADGTLSACGPDPDEPDSLGFSAAAARLASAMRMNLWAADGAPVKGGVVHIPIRLNLKAGGD